MKFPKLFGYDSKGKIKEWSVSVNGDQVIVAHGSQGGKIQIKTTASKPKNVGRANETTGAEQALKDAQSKWNKQIDKNYHEDLAHAAPLENPMLAHDYRKQGHRILYPALAQPKLDGVRCLVKLDDTGNVIFKSRGNKEYPVIDEIAGDLYKIFNEFAEPHEVMLDGELYIHGESLQTIISAVKKHSELDEGGNEIRKVITDLVEFHMFDYHYKNIEIKAEERVEAMDEIFSWVDLNRVKLVPTTWAKNEKDLLSLHNTFAKQGYEGVMVRNSKGFYQLNIRSADLQKYKIFMDEEFECISVEVDKDGQGVLVLKNHRWTSEQHERFKTFKAAFKGTHLERLAIASTPYVWIASQITIKYQGLTDAGIPQFPIALARREVDASGNPME